MKPPLHHTFGSETVPLLASVVHASAAASVGFPPNANPDHIANNDTLAWSLLAVLGLTLGMVTACGLGIYRQFRRSTPGSELLEEMKRQARHPGPVNMPLPSLPVKKDTWERSADWWKEPQD